MPAILSAKNLRKTFGTSRAAVAGVSLEVKEREAVALIGPNSSGKTTTQRMLATVLLPDEGTIQYKGMVIKTEADRNRVRRLVGYVPQGNCLYGDLTIEENMRIFSQPYGLDEIVREDRIHELIARLRLGERKKYLARDLSGGMAKRASIAAALVHSPQVLFLDEVTMGLDPVSRHEIWDLLREEKERAAIVMTTHYLDEVEALCDRAVVLARGKVVDQGTVAAITKRSGFASFEEAMAHVIKRDR